MGNSTPGRISSGESHDKKAFHSNNSVADKSRALPVDPRSPSEGIVRTPIQLGNSESFQFDDPNLKINGDTNSPLGYYNNKNDLFIDLSTFETLDGVLTEDDSIHRTELAENGVIALSDTEVTSKQKQRKGVPSPESGPRARLSWVERFNRRKSSYDSPSLFVRLRHKRNYEKQKNTRNLQQHGDTPQDDHFSKSEEGFAD